MAIYDNSTERTAKAAFAIKRWLNKKAIPVVCDSSPLVYSIMGGRDPADMSMVLMDPKYPNNYSPPAWMRDNIISGTKIKVTFRGQRETITGVADGDDELEAVTPQVLTNKYGAGEADITHLQKTFHILKSDLDKIDGEQNMGRDFLTEEAESYLEDYVHTISTGIHSTQAQSGSTIGGWQQAIADDNVYLTVNRALAENADFRSIVTGSTGALTKAKLRALQGQVISNGGDPDISPVNYQSWEDIGTLLDGSERVIHDGTHWTMNQGGKWFMFAGVRYVLDSYAPTAVVPMMTSKWWHAVVRKEGFNVEPQMVRRFDARSAYAVITDFYWAWICKNPKAQGKLTGVTYA